MLNGATLRAAATTGVAVFRIVVSNDSMKNATATSQGSNRRLAVWGEMEGSKPGIEGELLTFKPTSPRATGYCVFDNVEIVVLAFILVLTGDGETNGGEAPSILLNSKGARFQAGHRIVPNYWLRG